MPSVLIVSHCFPPDFSVGAKRALRMARHLVRLGWRVEVLTARDSYFEQVDATLEAESPGYETIRTHAIAPKNWLRRVLRSATAPSGAGPAATSRPAAGRPGTGAILQSLASAWSVVFSIPDEQSGWLPVAVLKGLRAARRADVILTTLPPRTSAVVAAILARSSGRPLVIDYRDPWMPVPGERQMPRWRQRIDRALERFCVRSASLIVATTEGLRRELAPEAPARSIVVPNAFDPNLFERVQGSRDDRFTLVYAGNFGGLRSAAPILEALRRLRETHRLPEPGLVLRVLGTNGQEVEAAARRLDVADLVEVDSFLPYREALSRMKEADVLLLVVADSHARLIPAKAFEYIAARRFILALVPRTSDAAALIEETQAGAVVDPRDIQAVADTLERRFAAPRGPISQASAVKRYEETTTMDDLERSLRTVLGET